MSRQSRTRTPLLHYSMQMALVQLALASAYNIRTAGSASSECKNESLHCVLDSAACVDDVAGLKVGDSVI